MASFGFNTIVSTLILNNLNALSKELSISSERLATTRRINRASDDPSGVVALSQFRSEIAAIDAATTNGQRIVNLLDTADGGLAEIKDLLDTIDTKVIAAADSGATADEKAAYQLEIDAAIKAINTIVNETTFNGTRLLEGSLGYVTSSVDTTDLQDLRINSADTSSGSQAITVQVTAIAEKAKLVYAGSSLGANTDFTLTGNLGAYNFSFTAGTTVATMVTAINAQKDTTGVEAVNNGGNLDLTSKEYGEDEFVSVNVTLGSLPFTSGTTSDYGVDPTVLVNGQAATTDGFSTSSSSNSLSVRFTLTESFATAIGSTTFNIDAGGAKFQLNTKASTRIDVGITSLTSGQLGNDTVGRLNSLKTGGTNSIDSGNFNQARKIVAAGTGLIAYERGRLGAISKYSVTSTLNAMAATKTQITSAISNIEDVDLVAETANNKRLQTLITINASLMSAMTTNANSVLKLLLNL